MESASWSIEKVFKEDTESANSFKKYVFPQYGILDEFIKDLTGIQYNDIKNATNFESAMKEFIEWIPKNSIIVSWSDNDKIQIEQELQSKNIELEEIENKINDLNPGS